MASPVLSKAWLNNSITGVPFTGIFKNYSKSLTKTDRLTDALNYLINTGLIESATGNKKYLVGARKETLFKTPPCVIRADSHKLEALQSINIDIDKYEHIYMNSALPANMTLTDDAVKLFLSKNEYVPVFHLFNDARIEQEMERRVSNHTVQFEIIRGKKRYSFISPSQRIDNDNSVSEDNFYDLDLLSNKNNALSWNRSPFLPIDNSLPSSPTLRTEDSSLFSSIFKSPSMAEKNTTADLENQISPTAISLEQELFEVESNVLNSCFYSSTFIEKDTSSNDIHRNDLVKQKSDSMSMSVRTNDDLQGFNSNNTDEGKENETQRENRSEFVVQSMESSSDPNTNLKETQFVLPSQTFEPPLDPIQNESSCKRSLEEEEVALSNEKRLKYNDSENEFEESTILSVEDKPNPSKSFSSSPMKTNSTITIGDARVDKQSVNKSNSIDFDVNSQRNDIDTFQQSSMVDKFNMSRNALAAVPSVANPVVHIDEASYNSEKDSCNSREQDGQAILCQIYEKLISSDTIVMSKSDITTKLKHMSPSPKLREQAIQDLVHDKLLVVGDWFSQNSIKGVVNVTGYLKGHPENSPRSQIEFASVLSKYSINFLDYETSFKKDKVGTFPRTLGASDIKQSTWFYSQLLLDTILSNDFLKNRLTIDPSALIESSNTESHSHRRIRKPKKIFSPSHPK